VTHRRVKFDCTVSFHCDPAQQEVVSFDDVGCLLLLMALIVILWGCKGGGVLAEGEGVRSILQE
jgi:hypothetical protein